MYLMCSFVVYPEGSPSADIAYENYVIKVNPLAKVLGLIFFVEVCKIKLSFLWANVYLFSPSPLSFYVFL